MENIVPVADPERTATPNIRNRYTVTDKADGERRLLYVTNQGRVYMITPAMHVIFTGAMVVRDGAVTATPASSTNDNELYNTVLDGEYVTHDKMGAPFSTFMAFDLYYLHGKSVRKEGFYPMDIEERTKGNFRFIYLDTYVQSLKLRSILGEEGGTSPTGTGAGAGTGAGTAEKSRRLPIADAPMDPLCGFRLQKKNFYVASTEPDSIFESCALLLSKIEQGYFPYNTDGIIFTPASMGVGADRIGETSRPQKITWPHSFKWKPPEFNTIDFLVTVQHDQRGQEDIRYMYQSGQTVQDSARTMIQYKTLILKCGYDPKDRRNPYNDVLQNRLPSGRGSEDEEKYKPVVFQPTDPYDPNACFCHVTLRDTGGKQGVMTTEEGDVFEANMIVEFRYDTAREGSWKWVPLRVRYDKTAELRGGMHNYGNSFHVANNNWTSIHQPITTAMLSTGEDIPLRSYTQNDVYYNRKTKETNTQALRNFHNLYVKRRLIEGVSQPGQHLIDFACGKAGDLSKWYASRLKFVLGVDVARDNIQNPLDGACARYLSECQKHGAANMPKCLFFTGDSGKNIRQTGDAFASAAERGFVKAVFGQGDKNPQELPPAVFESYGIGEPGFDVGSCQFALHYFFENEVVLHQFLRNVSDCLRVGGMFVGTMYDGEKVFDQLRNKPKGGAWTMMKNGTKIAEITKDFDVDTFPETAESLGVRIQVYQETINQVLPEYLVNFKYFTQLMDQYGFQLASNEEVQRSMRLPAATGSFEELYGNMMQEIRRASKSEYGVAPDMSEDEKTISFLNRYFVFKKVHTVNTENLAKIVGHKATAVAAAAAEAVEKTTVEERQPPGTTTTAEPATSKEIQAPVAPKKVHGKKLKTKLVIECDTNV